MTFVSPHVGWALGTAPCASGDACLALRTTTDAGRSWVASRLPAALVAAADRRIAGVPADLGDAAGLNVRFADPRDGWIYGALAVPTTRHGGSVAIEATLWSTHDGGLIWRAQPLHGLGSVDSIYDVEAAHGSAYLLESNDANGATVKSTPVAEDRWHVASAVALPFPAGGAEPSGALVLQGASGWLVEGNGRGTTGSARLASNGRWVSWTPPCASVGHSFAVPAASTTRNLVAVCVMGGFAYPLSRFAPPGATLGSSWLYFSNDGGATFHAGPELLPEHDSFGLGLASPAPGVILTGRDGPTGSDLIASFDGGVRWTVVHRGQPLFLGFTSRSQGVAILGSSNSSTTMIMTFDGGHHWAPVTF